MAFRFLHTGDWHIGKPFGRFSPAEAGVLRQARLDAIGRLAEAARQGGAAHVLIGGDLYDRPSLAGKVVREPLARMGSHADLTWHIIPGNHDPAASGGVWERVLRDRLPANVLVHLEADPVPMTAGACLLPAPLATKTMTRDPTDWMDAAQTPPGVIRVGLAHGSVRGFGSEATASINIAPERARSAGLDYLALGDWHGVKQIGPRVWYSGTPEPDGFLDNEPGFALLVTLDGPAAPPRVQRCPTGEFRWLERRIEAARATDLAALEAEVGRMGPLVGRTLLQVVVTGHMAVSDESDLGSRLDQLDAHVFHLSRRLENLTITPAIDDFDRLEEGALRTLGRELAAAAGDPGRPDSAVAARALRQLFALINAGEGARS